MRFPGLLVILLLLLTTPVWSQPGVLILEARAALARGTTLEADMPGSKPGEYWLLHNPVSGKEGLALVLPGGRLVFRLPDSLAAAGSLRYLLHRQKPPEAGAGIRFVQTSDGITAMQEGKKVFFYHTALAAAPADSPAVYARSGFIHPLWAPNGAVLSDAFPAGHAHQHALFAAWTNTRFRNKAVDFWNQQFHTGTVAHRRILNRIESPVCSQLELELEYRSTEFGPVLRETWRITLYPANDGYFLFDLETLQTNTSSDTLFLEKYHYGGMAFRGSRAWNPDDDLYYTQPWQLQTDAGVRNNAANQQRAKWVDVSGEIEGRAAGLTVFDHPANFRYPTPIRVHPSMPYWVYSPVITAGFYIAPGEHYQARYRYLVHNGEIPFAEIQRQASAFQQGPVYRWE